MREEGDDMDSETMTDCEEHKNGSDGDVSTLSGDSKENARGTWGRKLEFMLACVGYAVGLGNLWRFPYICMRNGGGAFLIPYFIFMLLCAIPMFFMELSIGQFASLSPLTLWKVCPLFKGLGWGMALVSGVCSLYYNMIIGWCLYYLGHSFTWDLPWASCNNDWNSEACVKRGQSLQTVNMTGNVSSETLIPYGEISQISVLPTSNVPVDVTANATINKTRTPSEEFWQFKMLELTEGIENLGGVKWELLLCLAASWCIIFLCLCKGIKSTGKVVYVTATVPYLFLTILLIRGCMLPGAIDGIKFYIIPDFQKLLTFEVWVEACVQIFYSLGMAWGALITMASYNKFHNNCLRDAIVIPIVNSGTSFYAGFVIFSAIGSMANQTGVEVKDVITSGPGLAFIAYPEAIAQMPFAPFWAVLFFLMVITLGMDTQFAMVETLCSGFVDAFPHYLANRRGMFTGFVCFIAFLIGIPLTCRGGLYIFQIFDWYCAAFAVLLIALLECLVLAYIYGVQRLSYDIELMIGCRPNIWFQICWYSITPGIMLVMFIMTCANISLPTYGNYVYPNWAIGLGWCIAVISIVPIPVNMVYQLIQAKGSIVQRICSKAKPEEDWGPALEKFRSTYKFAKHLNHNIMFSSTETPIASEGKHMLDLETGNVDFDQEVKV